MDTCSTGEGFAGQGVHFACQGSARQRSCSTTSLVQCCTKVTLRNLFLCCITVDESKYTTSSLQPSLGVILFGWVGECVPLPTVTFSGDSQMVVYRHHDTLELITWSYVKDDYGDDGVTPFSVVVGDKIRGNNHKPALEVQAGSWGSSSCRRVVV